MTIRQWEAELLGGLEGVPRTEALEALDYYREMFSDKRDAGMSEESIVKEFGDPAVAAKRIILENSRSDENPEENQAYNLRENAARVAPTQPKARRKITASEIIGKAFFTLLIAIPIAAVLVSLIVSFGVVAISGAAIVPAGILYTLASPFAMIFGVTFPHALANMGIGMATAGVGSLLFPCFFILTKQTAILSYKAMRAMYIRKSK